jgi:hypothetical protein
MNSKLDKSEWWLVFLQPCLSMEASRLHLPSVIVLLRTKPERSKGVIIMNSH